jgi:hypothetical protein
MRASIIQTSKEDGWRLAELAAALADLYLDMQIVFGKRVMEKADEALASEKGGPE